jgi:hypothetical protein
MERYINNNLSDITYMSELTLDILKRLVRSRMSRVKFALITYSSRNFGIRKLCAHLK